MKNTNKPLSLNELDIIYLANKIVFERAELYRDFTLTLNHLIVETYLGDKLTNPQDKLKHFNWCWGKTCNLLKYGQINFINNDEIYDQFMVFYFNLFYLVPNKINQKIRINNLYGMWSFIFDVNTEKNHLEMKTFITLYEIFEKSHNFS